jgi:predicted ATPase
VSRRLSYVIRNEFFIKTTAHGKSLAGTTFEGDRSRPPGENWFYDELIKQGHQIDTNNLAIAQIRDTVDYPVHDKLRRYLANITGHRLFNTDENAPIRNPQPLGAREADAPPTRLSRGGDNLSNVLYHLHNESKYQDYYEEFLLTLQRAFPSAEARQHN